VGRGGKIGDSPAGTEDSVKRPGLSTVAAVGLWLLAAADGAAAQICAGFPQAKDRLYSVYIAMVADDVRAIPGTAGPEQLSSRLEELARSYAARARFGDSVFLQKLIGIGLFTAHGSGQEPVEATFRVACDVAQAGPMVLEPLTCAAVALEGSRRSHPDNRALARRMVDLARDRIATDRNGVHAQRLVDEIAPILLACAESQ
jgi:hypothetical protein